MHASPHDYMRMTPSWWIDTLVDLGFKDVTVEPLVWDPINSATAVALEVGPFRLLRRLLSPIGGLIYAYLKTNGGERYPAHVGNKVGEFALSYLVQARQG